MTTITPSFSNSNHILRLAANICFGVVIIGQFIFALYIFGLYGVSGLAEDFERWNSSAPHGYVEKDLLGNVFFGVHVLLAGIITIGGPLQLMRRVRGRFPKFHRINGRFYISSAFLISIAGLYLAWVRGSVGGLVGAIFISINAFIILTCAFFTIMRAINHQLRAHREWAIRLFLAMSGVWFFRVCLMFWIAINQGIVGFDNDTFQGPALNALYVICYICPIVGLEIYFKIMSSTSSGSKWALSAFVFLMTCGIIIGTAVATMGMWLPSL